MLAAHRAGGRDAPATEFARCWDAFAGVRGHRPRRASSDDLMALDGILAATLLVRESSPGSGETASSADRALAGWLLGVESR